MLRVCCVFERMAQLPLGAGATCYHFPVLRFQPFPTKRHFAHGFCIRDDKSGSVRRGGGHFRMAAHFLHRPHDAAEPAITASAAERAVIRVANVFFIIFPRFSFFINTFFCLPRLLTSAFFFCRLNRLASEFSSQLAQLYGNPISNSFFQTFFFSFI